MGQRLQVFLVDDSAMLRQLVVSRIDEMKDIHLVGQAGTAAQAIDAIRTSRPDAVILDLRLPDDNGLEVLRTIVHFPEAPHVVIFTQYTLAAYRESCLAAGAAAFFDKANDFDRLFDWLSMLTE